MLATLPSLEPRNGPALAATGAAAGLTLSGLMVSQRRILHTTIRTTKYAIIEVNSCGTFAYCAIMFTMSRQEQVPASNTPGGLPGDQQHIHRKQYKRSIHIADKSAASRRPLPPPSALSRAARVGAVASSACPSGCSGACGVPDPTLSTATELVCCILLITVKK